MQNQQMIIRKYIEKHGQNHVLIHSDMRLGFSINAKTREEYFMKTLGALHDACDPLGIVFPVFNYDYCRTGNYSIPHDVCQVGALNEYFRVNEAAWRSITPVFNFAGTGKTLSPNYSPIMDPFDSSSTFGILHKNKALLMAYGLPFGKALTLIHYVERISGQLVYRYDKIFKGNIVFNSTVKKNVRLKYHVRPLNMPQNWDLVRIEEDLNNANLLFKYINGKTLITLARIDKIIDYWLNRLNSDKFYFLDETSRKYVEKKYNCLKRAFTIKDFE